MEITWEILIDSSFLDAWVSWYSLSLDDIPDARQAEFVSRDFSMKLRSNGSFVLGIVLLAHCVGISLDFYYWFLMLCI